MKDQQFIDFALFTKLIDNDIQKAIQQRDLNYLKALLKVNPQKLVNYKVEFENQLNAIVEGKEEGTSKYTIFLISLFE